jgi:hypothetical protein
MKDALKWLAILGGGYFLFKDQITAYIAGATTTTASTSAAATATAATMTATAQTQADAAATAAAAAAKAQADAAAAAAAHANANPADTAAAAAAAAAALAAANANAQVIAAANAAAALTAAKAKAQADAVAAAVAAAANNPGNIAPASILLSAITKPEAQVGGSFAQGVYQWNYYQNQLDAQMGLPAKVYPGPEAYNPPLDPAATLTAAQYLQLRPSAGGLSGPRSRALAAWRFNNYA